jgi:hypothetical protein
MLVSCLRVTGGCAAAPELSWPLVLAGVGSLPFCAALISGVRPTHRCSSRLLRNSPLIQIKTRLHFR